MDRGTYAAASGGITQLTKLEVVNNNLANVNTPGFKGQHLIRRTQPFEETLAAQLAQDDPYAAYDHERTPGVQEVRTVTDFSLGSIHQTRNPLDVALQEPNEFFVLEGPTGPLYTRAGNFTLNSEGQLSSVDGLPVSGDGGPIAITGPNATISSGGAVLVDGEEVGRLRVVRFADPTQLERQEGARFVANTGAEDVDDPAVLTQSLEMSNVSAIQSVIDLITATRGFELYTKTARSIDDLNNTAISQIGRRG